MALFDDLVEATGEGGMFAGYSLRRIYCVLASLGRHDHMRIHPDGRDTNKTQRRLLETPFMAHHNLSRTQYDFLLKLYDGSDLQGFGVGVGESWAGPGPCLVGTEPVLVSRYFACDFGPTCCGRSLKVKVIDAVGHTIGHSFAAKHVVKLCMGECKSVWYLNKRTFHEELDGDGLTTHSFYAWHEREPEWIASKSGKQIISTRLLTAFAMALCTMRQVAPAHPLRSPSTDRRRWWFLQCFHPASVVLPTKRIIIPPNSPYGRAITLNAASFGIGFST